MMQIILFAVMILGFITILTITVLAIVGRVEVSPTIKTALVSGVVIALATAVYQAFDEIDFGELTAHEFVESLPTDFRNESLDGARDSIRGMFQDSQECTADLNTSNQTIQQQEEDLSGCRSRLGDLESFDNRHFLFRLLRFDDDAARLGVTLNLTSPPDARKPDLARRLIGLLAELGEYEGTGEARPDEAKQALIAYQENRDMRVTGWYGPATFQRMVEDYAAIIAGGRRRR